MMSHQEASGNAHHTDYFGFQVIKHLKDLKHIPGQSFDYSIEFTDPPHTVLLLVFSQWAYTILQLSLGKVMMSFDTLSIE